MYPFLALLIIASIWFTIAHVLATFPILFPIHVEFSENSVSPKSLHFLPRKNHQGTLATMDPYLPASFLGHAILDWDPCMGLQWGFQAKSRQPRGCCQADSCRVEPATATMCITNTHILNMDSKTSHHVQGTHRSTCGLRLRTIMASNVPNSLRTEKNLQEYFEYYMSR